MRVCSTVEQSVGLFAREVKLGDAVGARRTQARLRGAQS